MLTKTTIKRINAHSNINKPGYYDEIYVIGDILCRSFVILGDSGRYEINDGSFPELRPLIFNDGERNHEFIAGQTSGEYETRIVQGLATRYPRWISGTLTHGLNGVRIYDVNKLVKAILDD